jgi:hypothetical protein
MIGADVFYVNQKSQRCALFDGLNYLRVLFDMLNLMGDGSNP